MNIIAFLCPLRGNGGIVSWSKKFLSTFPNEDFNLIPIDISPNKDFTLYQGLDRITYGIKSFIRIKKELFRTIKKNPNIQIMHIASGLGYGVIRDYYLAKSFRKKKGKCILHCHCGSVQSMYENNNILGYFYRKTLDLCQQIWVLDEHSVSYLKSKKQLANKVFLTPNSIDVPTLCDLTPKTYKKIGFVGNILPSKGIYELTKAVCELNNETQLSIIGEGAPHTLNHIQEIAGDNLDKRIFLLGRLSNEEAVKAIESLDIICLPTYYPAEAFPISILEAMSRGKLVISCPRAAIPDMLSCSDGTRCGILVPEKNAHAIADAILWCQNNHEEADRMCNEAYKKVKNVYDKDVVYRIYRDNYRRLIITE